MYDKSVLDDEEFEMIDRIKHQRQGFHYTQDVIPNTKKKNCKIDEKEEKALNTSGKNFIFLLNSSKVFLCSS